MSVYKVDKNLSRQDQIEAINNMVIEVNGKIDQAKFNKNELDTLYTSLYKSRKFLRLQSLGHTTGDYTDWSHLKEETGYSIWKLSPTSYKYNSKNKLYFDDKVLENRGEAGAESATSFDSVFFYNGDSGAGYTDNTAEAATEGGTQFALMNSTNDYVYIGDDATFSGVKFEWQTAGSNYTLVIEYWNGSWITMTANANSLDDDTNSFESDGKISFTAPSDWATATINSATRYWIRISTSTIPITVAECYYCIPYNCVPALLALSSTQIQKEEWAWCSYTTAIYVTIRNAGNASYEGDYFITSASNATNLQNYFIYNHEYESDYEDSTYNPVFIRAADYTATGDEGVILVDATDNNVTITLPSASEDEGEELIIKAIDISNTADVDCLSGETIDGSGTYTFSSQYECIRIMSDGSNWQIIGQVS